MDIIQLINNASDIAILAHIRPDGDCIGSGLALKMACAALEKKCDFLVDSPAPSAYAFMPHFNELNAPKSDPRNYDLIICVDCADEGRLGKYNALLKDRTSICIDHHYSNIGFCTYNHIDSKACSTCAILYKLLSAENLITKEIAACLYVGLSTDTGHFMHSNTTSEVFSIASALVDYGIDACEINNALYNSVSRNKIALTAIALQSIKLFNNNKIAVMTITLDDLSETKTDTEDTEGLIAYATNIKGVEVSVCMCAQRENSYKVSLRSKGVNVAEVAAKFGGGGHVRAAGCIVNGEHQIVVKKIVTAITSQLK